MLYDVTWISREPQVRHAFSLCRVVDAGTADQWYELLGVVPVPAEQPASSH